MTDQMVAEMLNEMADLDRYERDEAAATERAERGDIEIMVEDIIANHAHLGRDVAAVAALIGRKLTSEERDRAVGYMANRPYDEATWDVEMSILIASRNLSRD